MTIAIGYWIIPLLITCIIVFWPWPDDNGSGWGAGLATAFSALIRIIAVLFCWLAYFATLYFLK